jgi:hypothetical protein
VFATQCEARGEDEQVERDGKVEDSGDAVANFMLEVTEFLTLRSNL